MFFILYIVLTFWPLVDWMLFIFFYFFLFFNNLFSQILLRVLKLSSQAPSVTKSLLRWPAQRWCRALVLLPNSTGISMIPRSRHWEGTTGSSRLKSWPPSTSQTRTMDLISPALPVILFDVLSKAQQKQRFSTFPVSVSRAMLIIV